MNIDEAIKHCEEVAETEEQKLKDWKGDYSHLQKIDSCKECASEHRQLADWLKELKAYREAMIYLFTNVVNNGYLLHKWTDEFGYVIQVTDVISAFDEVKDMQNVNLKRESEDAE